MKLWRVALVLGSVGIVCLIVWWQVVIVHLSQWSGTSNEASRSYAFWSGIGGLVTILGALVAWYKTHECHTSTCHWPAHHTTAKGYRLCKKCIGKPTSELDLHPILEEHQ